MLIGSTMLDRRKTAYRLAGTWRSSRDAGDPSVKRLAQYYGTITKK